MSIRHRLEALERRRLAPPARAPGHVDLWRVLLPDDLVGREIADQFPHLLRPDWNALVRPVEVLA